MRPLLSDTPGPRHLGAPARPRGPRSPGPRALARDTVAQDEPRIPRWPHHRGRPRPGGHTEALRPSLLCPGRKAFLLQSTKAKRPGRALKSPGLGVGAAGGSGARWLGRAPGGEGRSARGDESGSGCRRTAATGVLAEKFCSQVGRREIVTQFKTGRRLKKIIIHK